MKKTIIALMALSGVAIAAEEPFAVDISLTLNGTTGNGGKGSLAVGNAITTFADKDDGAYMFNNGGQCNTDESTKEGLLWDDSNNGNGLCITLCPRGGAGGSGEVIIDSAAELNGYEVTGFTFNVADSVSTAITGTVTLTLAVVYNNGTAWTKVQENTSTLTIGDGSSVELSLTDAIESWGEDYKVAAMVSRNSLSGNNGSPYTLQGISISAQAIPEPTTATLGLLALAGLAARRRRK